MSDKSNSDFSDWAEEQTQDSETVEAKEREQSDKSFHEKITEFQNDEREKNPWEEIPDWKLYGGIIGGSLSVVLSYYFIFTGHPGWGAIFLSLPIIVPLVLTEGGREFLKTVQEEMQEGMEEGNQAQQSSAQSKPKRICSECGWQNPQENTFCHDCGSKLGKSE